MPAAFTLTMKTWFTIAFARARTTSCGRSTVVVRARVEDDLGAASRRGSAGPRGTSRRSRSSARPGRRRACRRPTSSSPARPLPRPPREDLAVLRDDLARGIDRDRGVVELAVLAALVERAGHEPDVELARQRAQPIGQRPGDRLGQALPSGRPRRRRCRTPRARSGAARGTGTGRTPGTSGAGARTSATNASWVATGSPGTGRACTTSDATARDVARAGRCGSSGAS